MALHGKGVSIKIGDGGDPSESFTTIASVLDIAAPLEEVHPLKQGLKPNWNSLFFLLIILEEVHPLKQGLKLNAFIMQRNFCKA